MEQYLRVGTITNTHALKGEVKAFPSTDDIHRFSLLKEVYLDEKHGRRKLTVRSVRYFKNMVILGFEGIDRIEDAEKIKGCDIYVDRKDAVPLEEGEYYIGDLLEMQVFDETGKLLGILTDVLQTGANDVYIVTPAEGKEILIPAIEQCIRSVDIEKGIMTVELLPGLLDL